MRESRQNIKCGHIRQIKKHNKLKYFSYNLINLIMFNKLILE